MVQGKASSKRANPFPIKFCLIPWPTPILPARLKPSFQDAEKIVLRVYFFYILIIYISHITQQMRPQSKIERLKRGRASVYNMVVQIKGFKCILH